MFDSFREWLLSAGEAWGIVTYYQSLIDGTTRLAWQEQEKTRRWKIAYIVAGICVVALLPLAYAVLFVPGKTVLHRQRPTSAPYTTMHWGPDWHGWHSINHMVVLGDSWSSTGFDIDGPQPSEDNPLGNPAFPGSTVTNGENWVDYLLYTYNKSSILTADLAVGGATIDSDLIKPGVPAFTLRSLKAQLEEFRTLYANSPAFPWTANATLFSVWFGVNDITAYNNETRKNFGLEYDEFAHLMEDLYELGARNYLLFNAPPLDRSPLAPFSDPDGEWPGMIDQWNLNFTNMTSRFLDDHGDVTAFIFDIHSLFDHVMDDPCLFPETCGFAATTSCCDKYMFGTLTPDFKDPDCEYSVDKYFWINRLHPSTQTHNMTAHVISQALLSGDDPHG